MPVASTIKEAMTRSSWIRRMFEKGAELKRIHGAAGVFDFTLGNPFPEPPPAFFDGLEELAARRHDGVHRYMPNAGFPEVRARIAHKLDQDGVFPGIGERHIVMSVGAAGGMNVTLKTILNPGDEVIVFVPYFAEYLFYITNHGGVPVLAETDGSFDIDLDKVAALINPKTRAIVVNSPNNPTGRIYPEASLRGLAALLAACEKRVGHPIYLIADEPYREVAFIPKLPPTPAALHPNSFLCYSWSKSLSLPGDRIGYVAVNPQIDDAPSIVDGLTFTTRTLGFVNAPAVMQLIVTKLLDVTVDMGWYRSRRDRVLAGLRQAGYDVMTPEGTFYVFPRAPGQDDVAFVNHALSERVLVVPGSGFGRSGYFRISYSVDDRTIDGGLEALARVRRSGSA
ncbi:MAG: pyridoxal phosphate-dependent aminotransferase [Deltaproteobacteria bacterium]|nr:pyridoxal phosphate-dependent aminotransferase [Deltaproteobacteria bacterium]